MPDTMDVQEIRGPNGDDGVFVPLALWREISSELETRYLLSNETNRTRLLAAMERSGGLTLEEVQEKLGLR